MSPSGIWISSSFVVMQTSQIWTGISFSNNNFFEVDVQLNNINVLLILPICPKHYLHVITVAYCNCSILYVAAKIWDWTPISYSSQSLLSADFYVLTKSNILFFKWHGLMNQKICWLVTHKYHTMLFIWNNRTIKICNNNNFCTIIHDFLSLFLYYFSLSL